MKTSVHDFRIGNWFYNSKEHETQVYKIDEDSVNGIIYTDFCGIVLTEEWLLKFGLDIEGNIKPNDNDIFKCSFDDDEGGYYWDYSKGYGFVYGWVEHVHQLQNLFFVLTGEELIKK